MFTCWPPGPRAHRFEPHVAIRQRPRVGAARDADEPVLARMTQPVRARANPLQRARPAVSECLRTFAVEIEQRRAQRAGPFARLGIEHGDDDALRIGFRLQAPQRIGRGQLALERAVRRRNLHQHRPASPDVL
ncbi:hypothetical protein [Burkholderia contaminans]|uniref:hypothetical protein n=1 Tax=Burkholderia contaminans TaxID=488447 RepID=UPI002D80E875|nr:hypothetical protein [Burkholderia contaminans]